MTDTETKETETIVKHSPKGHKLVITQEKSLLKEKKISLDKHEEPIVGVSTGSLGYIEPKEAGDTPMEIEKPEIKVKQEFKLQRVVTCDRCNMEIKLPLPECKHCEKPQDDPLFDEWGLPSCRDCKQKLLIFGTKCTKCEMYCPAPNESFDAGRVNFSVPEILRRANPGVVIALSDHELPIPPQTVEDISKDPKINEWVFNHLPMKEDQKKDLLADLTKEQLLKERDAKRKEELETQRTEKIQEKLKPSKLRRTESSYPTTRPKRHKPPVPTETIKEE